MTSIRRPAKRCNHPSCQADATRDGKCADHAHAAQRERFHTMHTKRTPTERRRRYGTEWAKQRERVLYRDGRTCVYCGTSKRLEVHHLADTDTPADRELVTLCYRHHRAIEAEAKRGEVGKVGNAVRVWLGGIQ